jgi:DNA-binding phage protein
MQNADELRQALADTNVQAVAKSTGIHANSIYRFIQKKTNPRRSTVARLVKYFDSRGIK